MKCAFMACVLYLCCSCILVQTAFNHNYPFHVLAPRKNVLLTFLFLFSQQMVCLESKLKGMMGTAPCARHMHDVIVMGGGVHKDQRYRFMFYPRNINSSLYAYFVRENRWAKMPDLPYGISKPLMAITEDGQLLVIDSVVQDDSEKQKQLLCYCSRENTWTSSKVIDFCCTFQAVLQLLPVFV